MNTKPIQMLIFCFILILTSCVSESINLVPTPSPTQEDELSLVTASRTPTIKAETSEETSVPPQISTSTPAVLTPTPYKQTLEPSQVSFDGPIVAFRMDDNDRFYLLLFDINTRNFREIRNDMVDYPLELQWANQGCNLFIRGYLTDLNGEIIRPITTSKEEFGNFSGTRLSPDQDWLAIPIYSGAQTLDGAEFVDVGIRSLTNSETITILSENGGAKTFAWSPDSQWLAYSDLDENGIQQLFSVQLKSQNIQQLTFHTEPLLQIDYLVWSPDGNKIAYAVSNYDEKLPNEYNTEYEGWVGLISIPDLMSQKIELPKLGFVQGIWWDTESSRIVFVGSSLPFLSEDDPLAGKQIHWINVGTGEITNSFYEVQAPSNHFNIGLPAGNIDTIFLNSDKGFYLLDAQDNEYELIHEFEPNGLIRETISAPFNFPGERICRSE